jgi:quinol monooxygenase YgiN
MYGTIAHMKIKPGKLDEFMALMGDTSGRQPKGYVGDLVYRLDSDPNQVIMAVVFQDKESYHANANDPEMDKEYQRYRALLEDDPHWHDGEIIQNSLK